MKAKRADPFCFFPTVNNAGSIPGGTCPIRSRSSTTTWAAGLRFPLPLFHLRWVSFNPPFSWRLLRSFAAINLLFAKRHLPNETWMNRIIRMRKKDEFLGAQASNLPLTTDNAPLAPYLRVLYLLGASSFPTPHPILILLLCLLFLENPHLR